MEKGTKKEIKRRVIVVGSEGHHGVETTTWNTKNMPNIADYDDVVMETNSLGCLLKQAHTLPEEQRDGYLWEIDKNLSYVKERLLRVLDSRGSIYVICSPRVSIKYGTTPWGYIDNYDWSPLPIRLAEESGETIELRDKLFEHYFQFVDRWQLCFEEVTAEDEDAEHVYELHERKYLVKLDSGVIAQNRYERPIAMRLEYYLRDKPKYGQDPNKYRIRHTSGSLILLPLPTKIDVKEAINVLIEDFLGIQQKTPPPEGIGEILLPGEGSLKREIEENLDRMEKLKAKNSDLETLKEEKTQFKQLIYETGTPLEDICKLTFSKLGCKVDDSVEDFILTKGEKEAIVEVKGREGTILRGDGSQLAQNRRNYVVQKGKDVREVKAILLGNPWRLEFPLEERAKKELFAPHLVKDAMVEDMALVSTVELLKAYCAFIEDKISSEQIIEQLFSGIGLTELLQEQKT